MSKYVISVHVTHTSMFKYVKVQEMSSWKVFFFIIISVVELSKSFTFNEFSNSSIFQDYFITSTNFSWIRAATLPNSKTKRYTCELELEKNVTYQVVLRLTEIGVVNSKTNVLICDEKTSKRSAIFKEKSFHTIKGFVITKKDSSSIVGYFKNNCFYGTLFLEKIVYFIEDLQDHPQIFNQFKHLGQNAVVFKDTTRNSIIPPRKDIVYNKPVHHISSKNDTKIYKAIIGDGKVCALFILIDNSFLTLVHRKNIESAMTQVMSALEEANSIFRSTDFDGDGKPDNIGFRIKYMVILESAQSPMNLLPKYTNSPIDVNKYLKTFSLYKFLNEVCLGVVFTGHSFMHDVVGGSYMPERLLAGQFQYPMGGICDRPFKFQAERNLNTVAISPKNAETGDIAPQFMIDVCLTHELGHSFGTDHDETEECEGHVMNSYVPEFDNYKSFIFSTCSREVIFHTIIGKGHCFEEYEDSFCGNGILEEGEECDCGTTRNCEAYDGCCVPRGYTTSCNPLKNEMVDCHPSQGLCCSMMCKYKNLSKHGLDCLNFERKCPCEGAAPCSCGVQGQCIEDTCISEECSRISLVECDCPLNVIENKCQTCCWLNNSCVPAAVASQTVLQGNRSFIESLNLFLQNVTTGKRSVGFGRYKDICNGMVCVSLYFRETNTNEFCLSYGQVGICNPYFQCEVPKRKSIYPSVQTYTERSGGATNINNEDVTDDNRSSVPPLTQTRI